MTSPKQLSLGTPDISSCRSDFIILFHWQLGRIMKRCSFFLAREFLVCGRLIPLFQLSFSPKELVGWGYDIGRLVSLLSRKEEKRIPFCLRYVWFTMSRDPAREVFRMLSIEGLKNVLSLAYGSQAASAT